MASLPAAFTAPITASAAVMGLSAAAATTTRAIAGRVISGAASAFLGDLGGQFAGGRSPRQLDFRKAAMAAPGGAIAGPLGGLFVSPVINGLVTGGVSFTYDLCLALGGENQ